jgi:hypothetical protein
MKKILLSMALVAIGFASNAQYYMLPNVGANTNPGGLNNDDEYPSGGGLATTWTQALGVNAAPTWSAAINLPFAFQFNGSAVNQFKVSNSGVVTFDVATTLAAPSFTPASLPNASIPDKSVCYWGIQGTGANDFVMQKTFGTAPNRQFWIFFSSFSSASAVANYHYASIVLEETTNKIYAVDQRNVATGTNPLTIGLQINSNSALQVAGSPSASFSAGADFTPADNTYYEFIPGVQPAFDLSVSKITSSDFAVAGNNNITGIIKNLGTAAITSLTINYTDNAGAVVAAPLTGLNIAGGTNYNFTHPTPWNATIGTHTIEAYATNPNSNVDQNTSNDKKSKSISVLSKLIQRTPLIEVFTSSTCPPCKPGNEVLHNIIDPITSNIPVTIKYQQNFPGTGDPYATTESINRRTGVYAIGSIPRLELDGGWDGNAGSFTNALLTAANAVPAQYEMNGDYILNVADKKVTGKVRYSPAFNNAAGNTILHIAVLEKRTDKNVKNNGEVEFLQVMKKMIPTNNGTILPAINSGVWDSTSFTYTFNGNYRLPSDGQAANIINHTTENSVEDFNNLYVISWLQSTNKSVYQAAYLSGTVTGGTPAGIANNKANVEVSIYPNPTSDFLNINLEKIEGSKALIMLVDVNGDLVSSNEVNLNVTKKSTIDVKAYASGIYSVIVLDEHQNSIGQQVNIK